MARAEVRIEKARKLRDRLKSADANSEAQIIDELIRSTVAARMALKQIYADNEALRKSN